MSFDSPRLDLSVSLPPPLEIPMINRPCWLGFFEGWDQPIVPSPGNCRGHIPTGQIETRDGQLLAQYTQAESDGTLGGLNALHSCAFLEVRPTTNLLVLRSAVRRGVGDAILAMDPYPDYLFHLTVGYFEAGASIETLVTAIEPLRTQSAGTLRVSTVDLVALPTDQRIAFPPLDPIARFTLRR